MNRQENAITPVHRFSSSNDIHFHFVTITQENFEVPDIEHRHGYWTVFFFLDGKGKHLIDFKRVAIRSGSIHIVLPGQVHALDGGKNFFAYALMFTEDFFLMRDETTKLLMRLFRFMDIGEAVAFDLTKTEKGFFTSLLKLIQLENEGKSANKGAVLLDLLSVFISKCSSALPFHEQNLTGEDSLLYIQLRHAVEKNFRRTHSVKEFASILHVSNKQLNDLCRKYTDRSALEFIHARIIVEAKRLLLFSEKPIKEIAYTLNFTDAAHFSNFFRQKSGFTPLEFRESNLLH